MYFRHFSINTMTSLNAYFCLSLWAWVEWQVLCSYSEGPSQKQPTLWGHFHASEFVSKEKDMFQDNLSVSTIQNWFVTNTDFFFYFMISMCLPHMNHIAPTWNVGVLSLMQNLAPNHKGSSLRHRRI